MAEDQDAKLYYVAYMDLHAQVQWLTRGEEKKVTIEASNAVAIADEEIELSHSSLPSLSTNHYPLSANFVGGPVFSYMVATVVLSVMLLSAWAYKITHDQGEFVVRPKSSSSVVDPEFVFVGRVTDMRDCTWKDDNTATIIGAAVSLGRKYSLSAGLMEITYRSGAVVILEGPCDYEVNSDVGGRLQLGKLVARVGKKVASGQWLVASANPQAAPAPSPQPPTPSLSTLHSPLFTISTPTAIVTDLGTEFGVEVDKEGKTLSHVFRGLVGVRTANGSYTQIVVLRENESVRVEKADDIGVVMITTGVDVGATPKFVRRMFEPPKLHEYAKMVLADKPLFYWTFDERYGSAVEQVRRLPNQQLYPYGGAVRSGHAALGSGLALDAWPISATLPAFLRRKCCCRDDPCRALGPSSSGCRRPENASRARANM